VQSTKSGVFYGTTQAGGTYGDRLPQDSDGAFFELDAPTMAGLPWTEKVLISFGPATGGFQPDGNLLRIGKTYYGTTNNSANGFGSVYAITP
jgi:hypothetical protein